MRYLTIILLLCLVVVLQAQTTVTLTQQGTVSSGHKKVTLTQQGTVTGGHRKLTLSPGTLAYAFFNLTSPARTSAGVYDASGTLYRTLWSGVSMSSGSHIIEWDGKDDAGNSIATTGKVFKVVSNNLTATWDGVIGNTSASLTGSNVLHGMEFIDGICIANSKIYCTLGYGEGNPPTMYLNSASPNSGKVWLLDVPRLGTGEGANYICADATNVYWAGFDPFNSAKNYVYATKLSDNTAYTFSSGSTVSLTLGSVSHSAIDNSAAPITGIAVQQSGNYLFIAHSSTSELHVFNKSTGALVQTLSYTTPAALATDGSSLWMTTGTNTVAKYTVNSDGTLTSATLTLSGLVQPQSITVNGSTVVVCDGGSSQQVKAFATSDGSGSWTLGTAGGYNNSPAVTNTKFYFSDLRNTYRCAVTFDTDGSFWVLDYGNSRMLHFNSSRTYTEQVAYLSRSYSCSIDGNDPTRVFADYLEYQTDYTSAIQSSWTLKNNWGYNIPATLDDDQQRFSDVQTLSNSHTYADLRHAATTSMELVELTSTGVRFIGDVAPFAYRLHADGSLRGTTIAGGTLSFKKRTISGFDGSNNPTWNTETTIASTTQSDSTYPVFGGAHTRAWYQFPNNTILSYAGNAGGQTGYHLGGIQPGTNNNWLWKTQPSTPTTYMGNFPVGYFDRGNQTQYQGNIARVIDSIEIDGYNGEFYKASQTNYYNAYSQDGLLLMQFGKGGTEPNVYGVEAPAGMSGNGFSWCIAKVNSKYYVWINDESFHAGIHRWTIDNINSIKVITVAAKAYTAPVVNTIDLMSDVPTSGTFTSTGTWVRSPNSESSGTNNIWAVVAGTKSYGKSKDIYAKLAMLASNYTITKDVGTVSSTNWTLSGNISFTGSMPNSGNPGIGGKYLEVLDAAGKIIARVKDTTDFSNASLYINSGLITTNTKTLLGLEMNFEYPFSLQATSSGITFTYHNYSAVTTAIYDAAADWQHPKYVRLNFWATSGNIYSRNMVVQDLKLIY